MYDMYVHIIIYICTFMYVHTYVHLLYIDA